MAVCHTPLSFLFKQTYHNPHFSRPASPHARLSGQDIKTDCVHMRGWMFRSVYLVILFTVIMDGYKYAACGSFDVFTFGGCDLFDIYTVLKFQ